MSESEIKIAIVEDRTDIREALLALFKTVEDIHCLAAFERGEDAVEKIPHMDLDIVLMDIGLPGIDGIECIKQLKSGNPQLQFMICTVYDEDEKVFRALEAGAHAYMLKSSEFDFLLDAIRELHQGGSPMSSDIARKVVSVFHRKKSQQESYKLTAREKEILELLSKAHSYIQIADTLHISEKTLKKHVYNIYGKLHVHSRTEAINKYYGKW
ncbi:MAG: response regulator transcription factor [Bacteroidia bacterium]|nr:response regulator transcription factor [Bacteroidia bacterium]